MLRFILDAIVYPIIPAGSNQDFYSCVYEDLKRGMYACVSKTTALLDKDGNEEQIRLETLNLTDRIFVVLKPLNRETYHKVGELLTCESIDEETRLDKSNRKSLRISNCLYGEKHPTIKGKLLQHLVEYLKGLINLCDDRYKFEPEVSVSDSKFFKAKS